MTAAVLVEFSPEEKAREELGGGIRESARLRRVGGLRDGEGDRHAP